MLVTGVLNSSCGVKDPRRQPISRPTVRPGRSAACRARQWEATEQQRSTASCKELLERVLRSLSGSRGPTAGRLKRAKNLGSQRMKMSPSMKHVYEATFQHKDGHGKKPQRSQ